MILEAREASVQVQECSPFVVIEAARAAAINVTLPDYLGSADDLGELLD